MKHPGECKGKRWKYNINTLCILYSKQVFQYIFLFIIPDYSPAEENELPLTKRELPFFPKPSKKGNI